MPHANPSVTYIHKRKERYQPQAMHKPLALAPFIAPPSNLTLLPGVRQLPDGHLYKVAQYPSGKQVMVPYQPTGAEPARTIPVPEPQPRQQRPLTTHTASDGSKQPVIHRPRRLHVVECRLLADGLTRTVVADQAREDFLGNLQPLVYSTDTKDGKPAWHILQASEYDFHVHYHIDQEVV